MKMYSGTLAILIGASVLGNICIAPLTLAAEIPKDTTMPVITTEIMSPMIPMSYAKNIIRIEANNAPASCHGHCFAPSSESHASNSTSGAVEIFASVPVETKKEWNTALSDKNYAIQHNSSQQTSSTTIVLRL